MSDDLIREEDRERARINAIRSSKDTREAAAPTKRSAQDRLLTLVIIAALYVPIIYYGLTVELIDLGR